LRLYDSRRRRKETLTTSDGRVRMYVCGITPYDTTHLGHAFTYVVFDVLGRNLRRHGFDLTHVQNVTDVDDDMLKRARRDGRDWRELARENVTIFREDMVALNVSPPTFYPYASEQVERMLRMIGRLIESDHAYQAGGNVYFRVARFPTYGELSGFGRGAMIELLTERGGDPADPRKQDPLDFVLWQRSAPDEPSWETPWGSGRPGWHIECSAMCYRYLGKQVDIHGGGDDLIYPHHESEIAQSESFTGLSPFARFWIHTGMLRYQGKKMSKSLGNMVFVRDLRQRYSPNAIRLQLLGHHYRQSFNFEESELSAAQELADQLASVVAERGGDNQADEADCDAALTRGLLALDDDLDTPRATAGLRELLSLQTSEAQRRCLRTLGDLLGLTFARP
jgi:L-cysteine:1D-myo-inositol 2-amino-2-deoxy-alpha-D-glucopyranoside ligase